MNIKKQYNIVSLFITFILLFSIVFTNVSFAANSLPKYVGPRDTDYLLLSTLVYDDSLVTPSKPKQVNVYNYPKFKKRCENLIKNRMLPYKSIDKLNEKHLRYYEIVKVSKNPKTGFFGVIFREYYKGKYLYTVVFRGTDNINGKIDIKDLKEDASSVVFDVYSRQNDDAVKLIQDVIKLKPSSIDIVGHSLGGFLAQVCASKILTKDIQIPKNTNWSVVTFNAPGFISNFGMNKLSTYYKFIVHLKDKLPQKVKVSKNSVEITLSSTSITHYTIKNDPVSSSIVGKRLSGYNTEFNIPTSNKLSFTNHGIDQFYKYGSWYK